MTACWNDSAVLLESLVPGYPPPPHIAPLSQLITGGGHLRTWKGDLLIPQSQHLFSQAILALVLVLFSTPTLPFSFLSLLLFLCGSSPQPKPYLVPSQGSHTCFTPLETLRAMAASQPPNSMPYNTGHRINSGN